MCWLLIGFGTYFTMMSTPWQPLSAAILRILHVLVRILLHHGVGYQAFADLAKWVYVDVATNMEEFAIEGRKQSISRAADNGCQGVLIIV